MMTFAARRILAFAVMIIAAVIIAIALHAWSPSERDAVYASGWVLLGMMVFLALYNLRKKLPYPSLGSSAMWLQIHIYVGYLTVFVYVLHAGFALPTGPLDITIAVLFALLIVSGAAGLLLTRAIPRRLSVHGEEVIFERIPVFRRQLRDRAEELVVDSVRQTEAMTLSQFYTDRLADYFQGPRHFWRHVVQSNVPLRRLTGELASVERYLDDTERKMAGELNELIEAKNNLDYHHAMQGVLKGWLFVHIPLTYVLMILVILHAVLMHTFVGAVR